MINLFFFLPVNSNVKIFAKKVEVIRINEALYAAALDKTSTVCMAF